MVVEGKYVRPRLAKERPNWKVRGVHDVVGGGEGGHLTYLKRITINRKNVEQQTKQLDKRSYK
jgi:hypothetical protein